MKFSIAKSGLLFATALVVFGVLLGACSSRAPQTNNSANTTRTSNAPATVIHVVTSEMQITFDRQPTQAGKYTFVVKNEGKIEHNFELNGSGVNQHTKSIAPGATESFTVDLRPGSYDFVCGVLGHAIAGMRGNFTLS